MKKNLFRSLLPALTLWLIPSCSSFAADFNLVGSEMSRILMNGHYARLGFDDRLSERILKDYIADLDPNRLYFEQSDIDGFEKKYATALDELLLQKNSIPAATEIYKTFQKRASERIATVKSLLKTGKFTFDSDRTIQRDRKDAAWPKNSEEATELWRLQLEDALLAEALRREGIALRAKEQGKPNPLANEASAVEKIGQRYERFIKTIEASDEEDIANYFLSAVAAAHDPHSDYFSARELQQFRVGIENRLVGIGALLRAEDDGATKIEGIVNNGPADRQGELKLKDRVVAVDSTNSGEFVDIMFMPLDKVVEMIRGENGVEVGLKVEPADGAPGETRIIVIKREEVTMKDELTTAEIISYGEGANATKLGVIKMPSFYFDPEDRSVRVSLDLELILDRLKKEGIDGLAIDLRGNGGGSLEEVRRITGFFVGDKAPVVQIKMTNGHIEALNSPFRKPRYEGPMVILTDKGSASASEILAGALQDYNRAVIIGESSTYGKGTVQQPLEIGRFMPILADHDRAGAVKLTIQKFYRVAGSSTQLKGVVPDIILPSVRDALEVGEKYAKHALAHDDIRRAPEFEPLPRQNLFVPMLAEKSAGRIGQSQDFKYVLEDTKRLEEQLKANSISLNIEKRRKEIAEADARRKTRNAERIKRFAEIAERDHKEFKMFRLTLDDVAAEALPEVDLEADNERHMRRAKDEIADLDDTPEWPSGLDATKREGLSVLRDLASAVKAAKVAGAIKRVD
ncbi:carboxy terminal-processing peptidase [Verrucomicrobiaceae bacterium 227]